MGGGVLGVRGLHSSFRTTQSGLSLNIGLLLMPRLSMFSSAENYFVVILYFILFFLDVSTTMIVCPGPVVDFLIANQNARDPFTLDWAKVTK